MGTLDHSLLRDALAFVEEHGFGENVDADSIIEEAAKSIVNRPKGALQTLIKLGREMCDDWHAQRGNPEVGDALAGYLQEITEQLDSIFMVSLVSGEGGASYEAFWTIEDAAKQARSWAASVGVVDGPNDDGDTVDVFRLSLSDLSIEGVPLDELP